MNDNDTALADAPVSATGIDAEGVARFLGAHPDFFVHYPRVLEDIRVPHERGEAVSLVERQMDVMRTANVRMRRQLHELIAAARDNERVSDSVQRFALELMSTDSIDDVLAASRDLLLKHFSADDVAVLLIGDRLGEATESGPWQWYQRDDAALACVANVLADRRIRCGLASEEQKALLFGDRAEEQASVALLPLSAGRDFGLLALGSRSEQTYTRDQGHLFLERVGELVSHALARFLD